MSCPIDELRQEPPFFRILHAAPSGNFAQCPEASFALVVLKIESANRDARRSDVLSSRSKRCDVHQIRQDSLVPGSLFVVAVRNAGNAGQAGIQEMLGSNAKQCDPVAGNEQDFLQHPSAVVDKKQGECRGIFGIVSTFQ